MPKNKIAYYFLLLVILSFLSSCYLKSGKNKNTDKLVCIEVIQMFPQINEKGKLTKYNPNPVRVYYYQDMKSYQLTYDFDSTADDVVLKSEERYHYFVFKNGQNYGFDYNPFKSKVMSRLTLDSAFKHEWIEKNNLFTPFTSTIVDLVSSTTDEESGELEEVYVFKSKIDSSEVGSCILNFHDRLKEFDISISRELDSIKKKKLYKAKFVANRTYEEGFGFVDQFEFNYSLRKIPVPNPAEVLYYFERFKEDDKNILSQKNPGK